MALDFQHPIVNWQVPVVISNNPLYTRTRVYKSYAENGDYSVLAEFNSKDISGNIITSWADPDPNSQMTNYYLTTYHQPSVGYESDYLLTFFQLLPREKRMITMMASSLPRVISDYMTDNDYRVALQFAIKHFNSLSPLTNYDINTFPKNWENLLFLDFQYFVIVSKYLVVSVRDFRTSIANYSMDVDRGSKMLNQIDRLRQKQEQVMIQLKWSLGPDGSGGGYGMGMGTVQLPISFGGSLGKNLMNVFDLMKLSF